MTAALTPPGGDGPAASIGWREEEGAAAMAPACDGAVGVRRAEPRVLVLLIGQLGVGPGRDVGGCAQQTASAHPATAPGHPKTGCSSVVPIQGAPSSPGPPRPVPVKHMGISSGYGQAEAPPSAGEAGDLAHAPQTCRRSELDSEWTIGKSRIRRPRPGGVPEGPRGGLTVRCLAGFEPLATCVRSIRTVAVLGLTSASQRFCSWQRKSTQSSV